MKKWILAVTLAGSVLALGACSNQTNSEVVAKSKSGNVTQEELYNAMKEKIGTQALQQLVFEKVLSKKFPVTDKEINNKVAELKEQLGTNFETALASNGFKNEDDLKQTMKVGMMQEKAAMSNVKVTDKDLKDYYDKLKPEITVRHILIKDEKKAKEVKAKLDAGGKFEDLAKENSEDPGSAQQGGDIGVINVKNEGSFDPDFVKGAYALKLNQISEPVKSSFGYHIIQVTNIKEKQPYDQMKKEVETDVKSSKVTAASINTTMKKLIKDAGVTISDKDLKEAINLDTTNVHQ